jgi:predicted PurR-regulated permease PerM
MPLSGRHALLWIMIALALWTAQDFLLPLALGVVLAVALWPLNRRWGGPGEGLRARLLVPLALTLATSLVFILPLTVALIEGAYQGQALLHWLAETQTRSTPPPEWLPTLPLVGHRLTDLWRVYLEQPGALSSSVTGSALATAGQWALAMGSGIASRSLLLLVGLMALFFLLRDGELLHARAMVLAEHQLGPFGKRFLDQMVLAVRGTVGGTLAVAIGEGVLIGLGYSVTGVPHAFLLALLTTAFALLPFGAWIMFSLASAILAINGSPFAAVLLMGYGAAIMVIGDNFVTPLLVGARVRLPLIFAFVGAFGGLAAFGLVGIFVGPVVMAGLLIVLREFWPSEEEADEGATSVAGKGD